MRFLFVLLGIFFMTASHAASFSIMSDSFKPNQNIPVEYTCDGNDASPNLSWDGLPEKTQSLVLILSDPDAPSGTFYHWIVYNLPVSINSLAKGISEYPEGSQIGNNGAGKDAYMGPCPPKGKPHRYFFTLYALDTRLNLADGANAETVLTAMKGHVLKESQIMAFYGRP